MLKNKINRIETKLKHNTIDAIRTASYSYVSGPKVGGGSSYHQEHKDLKYFIWCRVLEKGDYLKSRSGVVLPRPWGEQNKNATLPALAAPYVPFSQREERKISANSLH